jgi:hypothetical protein
MGGMRVPWLILGATLSLPARGAPPPTTCGRSFAGDAELRAAPVGTTTTIAALIKDAPTAGRFTVDGYIQAPHHCPACPAGATCKPCEEDVWLSSARGAYKGLLSPAHDLRVYVPDASRLELLGHYQLTIEVCAHKAGDSPLPDLELRGYRRLDPPVVSPRERLAPLRWMIGDWQCAGQIAGSPSSFTLSIVETLQGAWLELHMVMKTEGTPFELVATFGYARDRGWVRWDRNSNGGTRMLTSDGPAGETITFSTAAEPGGFREQMMRSPSGMAGRIDTIDKGSWAPAATFACSPRKP